ncbi:ketose-bisphosphate aldolase [Enterococcus gilvus]|nr:ketose-bisphosphate aldolase [Enterococcus gilvus]
MENTLGGTIEMYVTLKEVLKEANDLNMAIGAFNTHNLEMLPEMLRAAERQHVPIIIQTSCGTAGYVGHKNLVAICKSMSDEYGIDVVLHLDHAKDFNEIRKAIDAGYSSVMYDGSSLSFKENILGTKRVVEYARKNSVSVEAELGIVGGTEDGLAVSQDEVKYTDPKEAVEFVKQTGIDALAVAIGTNHGQYQSKTDISFDQLKRINDAVDIPLVIHGGTGVKDEDVKKVIDLGIRKFNVGTELLVGWNKSSKECYDKNKENTSNRDNVVPCLKTIDEIVQRKIKLFKNN